MSRPFYMPDPAWWPVMAESLAKPWPEEAVLHDLVWWDDQVGVGKEDRIPGRPTLRLRWGWTDHAVRTMLRSEAWRSAASASPARRQPAASRPPAPERMNADNRPGIASRPPADRQPAASESPQRVSPEPQSPRAPEPRQGSPKPPQPSAEGAPPTEDAPGQLSLVAEKPPARVLEETLQALGVRLSASVKAQLVQRGWVTAEVLASLPPTRAAAGEPYLEIVQGLGRGTTHLLRDAVRRAGHELAENPKPDGPGKDPRTKLVTDLWAEVFRDRLGMDPTWDGDFHRERVRALQIAESARVHLDDPKPGLGRVRLAFQAYLGDIARSMSGQGDPDPAHWPHEPTLAGFVHPQRLAGRFTGRAEPRRRGRVNLSAFDHGLDDEVEPDPPRHHGQGFVPGAIWS